MKRPGTRNKLLTALDGAGWISLDEIIAATGITDRKVALDNLRQAAKEKLAERDGEGGIIVYRITSAGRARLQANMLQADAQGQDETTDADTVAAESSGGVQQPGESLSTIRDLLDSMEEIRDIIGFQGAVHDLPGALRSEIEQMHRLLTEAQRAESATPLTGWICVAGSDDLTIHPDAAAAKVEAETAITEGVTTVHVCAIHHTGMLDVRWE